MTPTAAVATDATAAMVATAVKGATAVQGAAGVKDAMGATLVMAVRAPISPLIRLRGNPAARTSRHSPRWTGTSGGHAPSPRSTPMTAGSALAACAGRVDDEHRHRTD